METKNTQQYKRTSRHPSEETKERISQALRGRPKSDEVRQAISASMVAYWGDDANFPDDNQGEDKGGWLTDLVEDITGDQ